MGEPLHCLVEIPKGSRSKYEWDAELGTLGEDGDPLDGWYERDVALRIIEESRVRWREKRS